MAVSLMPILNGSFSHFAKFSFVSAEAGLSSATMTTEALFRKDIKALARLSESEIDDVFEGAAKCQLFFTPDEMTALDLAMKANCFESECMFPLMHQILDKALRFAKYSIIACL